MNYAFIPARGGSERVVQKNLRTVGGTTLVARAVRCAQDAELTPVVSTDDEEIAVEAERWGALIHHRPQRLSGAHAQIEDAVSHWLRRLDPVARPGDVVAILQPTSPFRRSPTVARCVELVESGYDCALTISVDHRNTGRIRSFPEDGVHKVLWNAPVGDAMGRPRSQEARQHGIEDGVCWAFSVAHFRAHRCRMGGTREAVVPVSWLESFEIDHPWELEAAQHLAPLADGMDT